MVNIIRIEGKWYRALNGVITISGVKPKSEKVQKELHKLIRECSIETFVDVHLAEVEWAGLLPKERIEHILNVAMKEAGL
jgi:hypothetical protein